MSDEVQMVGQIDTSLSINALSFALSRHGLRPEVRESCHYTGGCYILLGEGASELTLERVTGEFLLAADAVSAGLLESAAGRVSDALVLAGIRHRFELYNEQSELIGYWNFNWPRQS